MKLFSSDLKDPSIGPGKTLVLGIQHTFTMFGATVLVPILTGLDISVALFMAGVGTLIFHLITRGKIPVFLGSSFAFISPIVAAAAMYGGQLEYALGGVVVSGLIYAVLAIVVYFVGADVLMNFFPPIVTGPVIMVIGLGLASTAVSNASENWLLALLAFGIVVIVSVFLKGFARSLPVLIGLLISFGVAIVLTLVGVTQANPAYQALAAQLPAGALADPTAWPEYAEVFAALAEVPQRIPLVDFSGIMSANWIGLPAFTVAKFDWGAIAMVALVAICTMVEHIGDVASVGAICNRNFIKDPGLHRTLLGDGIASAVSAMFGGPPNTTYSENTGVLALTRAHNPVIMRIAAVFAIILGFSPVLGECIRAIPNAIIGGISIVLFGMIAAIGVRTVVENKVDFHLPRNLVIAAAILVLGIGGAVIKIGDNFSIEGMALAAIVGIILNKVLPGGEKLRFGKNKAKAESGEA